MEERKKYRKIKKIEMNDESKQNESDISTCSAYSRKRGRLAAQINFY